MWTLPCLSRVAIALLLPSLLSCGGGGGGTPAPPAVSVTIQPGSAALLPGATQQFSASVANASNTAVTWSVQEGAGAGSISATGLYTAPTGVGPAPATFHVAATSVADSGKSAVALVTVAPPIAVAITPGAATLLPGGTQAFSASVVGTTNQTVTWSVQEGTSGGSITAAGLYTAPASITGASATFHVVATSAADPARTATAAVGISALPAISSFTATPGIIAPGATVALAWSVANAQTLTINQGVGTVSGSSTTVAPLVTTTYTLIASNDGGSVNRSVTVTVQGASHLLSFFVGDLGGSGNLDGPGSAARFNQPRGVAVDPAGIAYVVDTTNSTIRKVLPDGTVSTLAGSAGQLGSEDGTGSAARFKYPGRIARCPDGTLVIAEPSNHTLRRMTPAGVVTTLAGSPGQSGAVDGVGSTARFWSPRGMAVDEVGNVFLADRSNHAIRKITPAAVVTTLAGAANQQAWADGQSSAARFYYPEGIAWDGSGNRLLVGDSYNHVVRTLSPEGLAGTLAGAPPKYGSADGQGAAARFWGLRGGAADAAGNLYVAETGNKTIRKVSPDGTVSTFAGLATQAGDADGQGSAARFNFPVGTAVDGSGTVYVVDSNGSRVRKITPGGLVSTFAGGTYGSADGTGTAARFAGPNGIAVDGAGNVFVTDSGNHTIRRISPAGVVTTVAGIPGNSGSADGQAATATFYLPQALVVDGAGNLIVCDTFNHTLRKITPGGTVTTLAGSPGQSGSADGAGATARFNTPLGICLDPASGNLLVADTNNATIRVVTPAGVVSTLAGQAGRSGTLLGALPGVIPNANGVCRLPDGRFALTCGSGVILLTP